MGSVTGNDKKSKAHFDLEIYDSINDQCSVIVINQFLHLECWNWFTLGVRSVSNCDSRRMVSLPSSATTFASTSSSWSTSRSEVGGKGKWGDDAPLMVAGYELPKLSVNF